MFFVARNGETGKIYLVRASNEENARTRLGDEVSSDGDEFAIVPVQLDPGVKVLDISELIL